MSPLEWFVIYKERHLVACSTPQSSDKGAKILSGEMSRCRLADKLGPKIPVAYLILRTARASQDTFRLTRGRTCSSAMATM